MENISCTLWNFSSNSTVPDTTFYFEWEKYLYEILVPIMVLFAILSNSFFLIVVARVDFMRTITNFYLVNLAISDMLYIFGTSVFFTVRYFSSDTHVRHDSSLFGRTGCYITYFFGALFFYASMILVSLVSLDRYIAICHPLKHLVIKSKGKTVKIVVAGWVVAIICSVVTTIFYLDWQIICVIWPNSTDYTKYEDGVFYMCGFGDEDANQNVVVIIGTCIAWILTSACNVFFYTMLLRNVIYADRDLHVTNKARNKKQVSLILVINGTIFFVCSTMYFISFIIVAIGAENDESPLSPRLEVVWFWMIYLLTFVNSSVHSVVYNIASQQYRKAFFITLTCRSSTKSNHVQSSRTTASRL